MLWQIDLTPVCFAVKFSPLNPPIPFSPRLLSPLLAIVLCLSPYQPQPPGKQQLRIALSPAEVSRGCGRLQMGAALRHVAGLWIAVNAQLREGRPYEFISGDHLSSLLGVK